MNTNELLNQCLTIIIPALATLVATILTYFASKIKSAYEGKINLEATKKTVADVVNFIEQVYKNIGGDEKKQLAIEKVTNVLNEKGIKVNTEEVSMLIESAVYQLNQAIEKETTSEPEKPSNEEVIIDPSDDCELMIDEEDEFKSDIKEDNKKLLVE